MVRRKTRRASRKNGLKQFKRVLKTIGVGARETAKDITRYSAKKLGVCKGLKDKKVVVSAPRGVIVQVKKTKK